MGTLANYWKYQRKPWEEIVSQTETWEDAVNASLKMFDAVATDTENALNQPGNVTIQRDTCFISAGDRIIANHFVKLLYGYLTRENPSVEAYEKLLSLTDAKRRSEDNID